MLSKTNGLGAIYENLRYKSHYGNRSDQEHVKDRGAPVYHPVGPSQLLSRVEAELDAPLFYRTPGKPLELSDVGEQFYAMAKEVISTYDAFLLGLRTKPLNIGISMQGGKIHHRGHAERDPQFFPGALHLLGAHPRGARDGGPQPLGRPGVLQASRHSRPHKLLRDPARSHRHLPPEGKPQGRPGPPAGRAANIPPCRSSVLDGDPLLPAGQRPSHPEGDGGCAAEIQRKA